jgi:periplasmic divalent cation tolerance protein
MASAEMCIVLTTIDTEEAARALARRLIDARAAACVQVAPIRSYYVWDGEPQEASEQLLLVKTTNERYPEAARIIAAEHPYAVPEIVEVPVSRGHRGYLDWVRTATELP